MRYQVLSPDELPIAPTTYAMEDAARKALTRWCQRFTVQGYYAGVSERIDLASLPGRCQIVEQP